MRYGFLLLSGLRESLAAGRVDALLGKEVSVSVLPPDRVVEQGPAPGLNLFHYGISHSDRWQRSRVPGAAAGRGASPGLGLDLHYLLTAFATEDLHAEVLVGHAVQCFEDHPVVSGEALGHALARSNLAGVAGGSAAGLANRVESIQVMPRPMTDEALFSIWQALSTPYRPTLAYDVRLVIDAR